MASISTKKSVLGYAVETTEGVLRKPQAAGDYIALRDDWDFSPAFDTLENEEVKANIGRTKPVIGAENPTASGSAYLRGSGAAATAPAFGPFLKAFFGSEVIASTEYDTAASSTTTLLKLPTGEAANFDAGQGLLIKDGVNGHRIRAVHASDDDTDLELSFALPDAPASGVNLGRSVSYAPTNENHQTLSLWHYVGNGGAVEAEAGCRCTGFSFEANAKEMLDASFDFEGTAYYFDGIEIDSTNDKLDFEEDTSTELTATIPSKWYKDPHELADAVASAMNSVGADTHTVTYQDSSGKFIIASDGSTLDLLWNTGTNTATSIGETLGFAVAADDGSALTYTADNAQDYTAPHDPTYDDADPLVVKYHEVMFGDQDDYVCFDVDSVSFDGTLTRRIRESICEESGNKGSTITAREGELTVTGELQQYDAKNFNRFREGKTVRFQYSFGPRIGGNWVAGKSGCLYLPTGTISSFEINEDEGVATFEMTIQPYVVGSAGEMFLNFVS